MKKLSKYKRTASETNYWQSYSDMMAALLLIFVLIIAVAIVALNSYKDQLAEQNEELLARQELLEKQAEEYLKLKEELEAKQKQIDNIIGVKQEIIEALNTELTKQNINIKDSAVFLKLLLYLFNIGSYLDVVVGTKYDKEICL